MQNLKDIIANIIIKQKLKKRQRQKQFVNLQNAKTIAVLAEINESVSIDDLYQFSLNLKQDNPQIIISTIIYSNQQNTPNATLDATFITPNVVNWLGQPKTIDLNNLIDTNFDILIDTSLQPNRTISYFLSLSNSKFKVGANHTNYKYYDLIIEEPANQSIKPILQEIQHYLKTIKTK